MGLHGPGRTGAAALAIVTLAVLHARPAAEHEAQVTAKVQTPAAPTAARLRAGGPPAPPPVVVVGGGEVALDVTVGAGGGVTRITPVRATPPYTEMVTAAVRGWRFEPARAVIKRTLQPAEGHVLVVAVFRPPQVYASPALGEPTTSAGAPSPELPAPGILQMPEAYPPRAVRDGTVLVEIEMSAAGMPTTHRVVGGPSPFDDAALETVRTWRFGIPSKPTGATRLFAYAIVGFREPITQ